MWQKFNVVVRRIDRELLGRLVVCIRSLLSFTLESLEVVWGYLLRKARLATGRTNRKLLALLVAIQQFFFVLHRSN